jgi:hypothetical protein
MKVMSIKQFLEITGIKRTTLTRRLNRIDAHPVGTISTKDVQTSYLWSLQDLVKASLLGEY